MVIDDLQRNEISILEFLKSLPDEAEREFEVGLTSLAESRENNNLEEELKRILENKDSLDESVVYAAFYCLTILYRRRKDISLLEKLIRNYENQFENHPTFSHIFVLYLKEKGIGKDPTRIIQKSYESYLNLKNNAGIVHNFAETIVSGYEETTKNIRKSIAKEWLDKAQEAVNLAVRLDPSYAKYYCTRGRLLAINKKYSEAKEDIKRAIDIEDSLKTDYVVKLGNYQYYLLVIQANEYSETINAQLEENEKLISATKIEIDEKFKESNIRGLEFLGFFAAIVSFTIGSIQIINNQTFDDALKLIVALFVVLLTVFSGFGIILHGFEKKFLPQILMFGIGLIIIFVIIYV